MRYYVSMGDMHKVLFVGGILGQPPSEYANISVNGIYECGEPRKPPHTGTCSVFCDPIFECVRDLSDMLIFIMPQQRIIQRFRWPLCGTV